MKKGIKQVLILLAAILISITVFNSVRNGEWYNQKILEQFLTPGMTMEEAVEKINSRGYSGVEVITKEGASFPHETRETGVMHIRFSMRDFKVMFLLDGNITALVAFDENGRLIRSAAWHTVDSV